MSFFRNTGISRAARGNYLQKDFPLSRVGEDFSVTAPSADAQRGVAAVCFPPLPKPSCSNPAGCQSLGCGTPRCPSGPPPFTQRREYPYGRLRRWESTGTFTHTAGRSPGTLRVLLPSSPRLRLLSTLSAGAHGTGINPSLNRLRVYHGQCPAPPLPRCWCLCPACSPRSQPGPGSLGTCQHHVHSPSSSATMACAEAPFFPWAAFQKDEHPPGFHGLSYERSDSRSA